MNSFSDRVLVVKHEMKTTLSQDAVLLFV